MNIESLFEDHLNQTETESTTNSSISDHSESKKVLNNLELKQLNAQENEHKHTSIYKDYFKILKENEPRPSNFFHCFSIYMSIIQVPIKHFGVYISYNDMTEYFIFIAI